MPDGTTLSIPDDAKLSIPKDVVLTVPESAALNVIDGTIVNNGTIVLPENSNTSIQCTGSGIIKKGSNLYTNNYERLYSVIVTQNEQKSENYYKENDSVKLVPEQVAEGMIFKEWKVTPDTVKITNNIFTMPAEDVTIEAVYEAIPPEVETPAPETPEETTSPTKSPDQTKVPDQTKSPDQADPTPTVSLSPDGNIIVIEPVIGDDAPYGYTASTQNEIKEAVLLTSEEEAAVANGSEIKIYLRIEKKTVTWEEKQIIDAAKADYTIGEYIDVSMFKQIDDREASPVRQLNKKIEIRLVVPENLRNKNNNLTRIYAIIRRHSDEDKAEIIEGTYDEETFIFTFLTDCFSTYTIVYKDTEKQTGSVNPINGGGYATDYTYTSSPNPSVTPSVKPSAVPTIAPSASTVPTIEPTQLPQTSIAPNVSSAPPQQPVKDNETPIPTEIPADKTTEEDNALTLNAGFKVASSGNKIKVLWGKVSKADGYDVYIQYCGKKFNAKPSNSVKGGNVTSVNINKINGKKLKPKKSYKLYIAAYRLENGKKITMCKSIIAHNAGAKSKKYTNAKDIELKKVSYTLKEGETVKINAHTILVDKNKKLLSDNHAKEFRYATSDKEVAAISLSGKIKAVGKGSCIIYVYSKNGNTKKIQLKVN